MIFHNRTEAGRKLAAQIAKYAGRPDVVVLALPRGGVPVAFEVARPANKTVGFRLVSSLDEYLGPERPEVPTIIKCICRPMNYEHRNVDACRRLTS
jgi:predicted phosphoribosyltransferase